MTELSSPGLPSSEGPRVGRRTVLAGVGIGFVPAAITARIASGPSLLLARDVLPNSARTGDVTTRTGVVWARGARPGRMYVDLHTAGRRVRQLRGPFTDERADLTARLKLSGLTPGREYDASVWFADNDGTRSETTQVSFRTAPIHDAAQSFVWSGDTCGQGWGINPELGGLTAYAAMAATRPDFFIHCGDTIYGDEPMEETTKEADGQVWRNELTEAVTHVSETLEDFRGRHRYPLRDQNVRDFYARVPTLSQWDDHETVNNWYPGEQHDDERYTERDCDLLAARGRRAWQEYQPVAVDRLVQRDGDGFAVQRIYRQIPRGRHLDVFLLDMRSFRGDNPTSARAGEPGILGPTQEAWLIDSLARSTATWKVISADMPLSIPSSHLDDLDGPCNGQDGAPIGREVEMARVLSAIKERGITGVVWITADVHYTAAHYYEPDADTDFSPFWEFVSGPIAAGAFATKDDKLDRTFNPKVMFSKGNETNEWNQSPRAGNQFFGQMQIAADGTLTVTLRQAEGSALWARDFEPPEAPQVRGR